MSLSSSLPKTYNNYRVYAHATAFVRYLRLSINAPRWQQPFNTIENVSTCEWNGINNNNNNNDNDNAHPSVLCYIYPSVYLSVRLSVKLSANKSLATATANTDAVSRSWVSFLFVQKPNQRDFGSRYKRIVVT